MRRAWSPSAEKKLRKLYARAPWPTLCFQLKRTRVAILHHARKLGLQRHRPGHMPWTAEDLRQLRKRYPRELTSAVARELGRDSTSVYNKAHTLGLHKTKKFLSSEAYKAEFRERARTDPRMIAGRFKKGQVPPNKGLRRPGWAPGRMAQTQFKKGQLCGAARHNYVPIGTLRICADGYLERKVTDDHPVPARRWVAVHRLVWEAAHGPIPKGRIVRFRAGMKTTELEQITVDKLEMVTHAENMRRNSYHNYPKPIARMIQLRGALNRQINRRKKREQQHTA